MKNPWRWIVASVAAALMASLFMLSFAPPASRFLSVFWLLYIAYASWTSANEGLKP